MTALADLSRADRQRLAARLRDLDELADLMRERGGLPAAPEPAPLCRARDVTDLAVTPPGSQGGLTAPARAVPPVRPPGERAAARGAQPRRRPGEPQLHLPAQAPDRRLGRAQLMDHPPLDGHVPDERVEVVNPKGQDEIRKPPLRGMPGHVTTIAVT